MIEDARGNLLNAEAEALVNTVNCVGVMGKGIALQFKQAYPEMNKAYERACERGEVVPGRVQVWPTGQLSGPKYIINFPTKREWFRKSSYGDIQSGLISLVAVVRRLGIASIAVPPLGCGNGGLSWAKVRPMIVEAFAALPEVRVLLFAPAGAPATTERVIKTERPKLTRARALFIAAIDRYSVLAYQITLLEIQKLAYFLQEAGEPLRLKHAKAPYGPYADNLNKVLETLEGHYISGFDGERSPEKEITLSEGATTEAAAFLKDEADARTRLDRVGRLIEGFETPYGMELLSSVHYVAVRDNVRATSAEDAVVRVHAWNDRKKATMKPEHIRIAWSHLQGDGWIPSSAGG
ncbi:MAG: macro domain-containing protein [Phycisphaerales bacterium]|nr:macro domain-containing protein [Phycisphaerales bacterium]